MIARVAISADALRDLSNNRGRAAQRDHLRLLDLVAQHGSLIFPDDDAASAFVNLVKSPQSGLPPAVSRRWLEVLVHFRKNARMRVEKPWLTPPLRSDTKLSDLGAWDRAIDVAVVDEETGSCLGVPPDQGWTVIPGRRFEIATADAVEEGQHMAQIRLLRETGFVAHGKERERFWHEILQPIWASSSRATLLDRYLFKGLWSRWGDHLQWLLGRMANTDGVRGRVTLIGEAVEKYQPDIDEVAKVVAEACSGGRIERVTVHLVPEKPQARGSYMPHDRHIRFNTAAVLLPAGFDRLSHPKIRDLDGLHWDYRWATAALSPLRKNEERAIQHTGTLTREVVT